MEEKSEKMETISSDIKYFERGRHFGAKLDEFNRKQMSPEYIGIDFMEMNHDQLIKFFTSTDRKKFEMAYWAQKIHSRNHGIVGIILGSVATLILLLIIISF